MAEFRMKCLDLAPTYGARRLLRVVGAEFKALLGARCATCGAKGGSMLERVAGSAIIGLWLAACVWRLACN